MAQAEINAAAQAFDASIASATSKLLKELDSRLAEIRASGKGAPTRGAFRALRSKVKEANDASASGIPGEPAWHVSLRLPPQACCRRPGSAAAGAPPAHVSPCFSLRALACLGACCDSLADPTLFPLRHCLERDEVMDDMRQVVKDWRSTAERFRQETTPQLLPTRVEGQILHFCGHTFRRGDSVVALSELTAQEFPGVFMGANSVEAGILLPDGTRCRLRLDHLRLGRIILKQSGEPDAVTVRLLDSLKQGLFAPDPSDPPKPNASVSGALPPKAVEAARQRRRALLATQADDSEPQPPAQAPLPAKPSRPEADTRCAPSTSPPRVATSDSPPDPSQAPSVASPATSPQSSGQQATAPSAAGTSAAESGPAKAQEAAPPASPAPQCADGRQQPRQAGQAAPSAPPSSDEACGATNGTASTASAEPAKQPACSPTTTSPSPAEARSAASGGLLAPTPAAAAQAPDSADPVGGGSSLASPPVAPGLVPVATSAQPRDVASAVSGSGAVAAEAAQEPVAVKEEAGAAASAPSTSAQDAAAPAEPATAEPVAAATASIPAVAMAALAPQTLPASAAAPTAAGQSGVIAPALNSADLVTGEGEAASRAQKRPRADSSSEHPTGPAGGSAPGQGTAAAKRARTLDHQAGAAPGSSAPLPEASAAPVTESVPQPAATVPPAAAPLSPRAQGAHEPARSSSSQEPGTAH